MSICYEACGRGIVRHVAVGPFARDTGGYSGLGDGDSVAGASPFVDLVTSCAVK